MTSLAHTPVLRRPVRTNRTDSGTLSRTSRVNHALARSVDPTPKAKHPSAPAMQVCESEPTTTCPGRATSSMMMLWQIPSEPADLPSLATSP